MRDVVAAVPAALAGLVPGRDFDALAIGGSAGAFSALRMILPSLNNPRLVAVVVLHQAAHGGDFASLFDDIVALPCVTIEDKTPARPGTIYFAPAGYHLLIEDDGRFALSVDPPVNFSRPSIDVLFESAARAFGARVVAIVLTGANDDGARGLKRIAERGGIAVVQDPREAEVPLMPASAARLAAPHAVLGLEQLIALFTAWSDGTQARA